MKQANNKNQNYGDCVLATHASDIHGPPYALLDHLLPRTDKLVVIKFPLSPADKVRPSYYYYERGELKAQGGSNLIFRPFLLNYPKDILLSIWWAWKLKRKFKMNINIYFGCNNLLAITARVWKFLLGQKTTIFYSVDYSDARFPNKLLNDFYLWIDKQAAKRTDFIWSNTHRTRAIRRGQGVQEEKNVFVPNGSYAKEIKEWPSVDDGIVKVIYHGYISETKGIQFVIEALNTLDMPNFIFDIYGYGPYEEELKELIAKSKFAAKIKLRGTVDNKELLKLLGQYDLSVALIYAKENYIRYGDAMKVKDAIVANVPVLMSDVTEFSEEVIKKGFGIVTPKYDDKDEIARLLKPVFTNTNILKNYKENISKFRTDYDWDNIFIKALSLT